VYRKLLADKNCGTKFKKMHKYQQTCVKNGGMIEKKDIKNENSPVIIDVLLKIN
jgi:hypothetical protein